MLHCGGPPHISLAVRSSVASAAVAIIPHTAALQWQLAAHTMYVCM